MTTAPKLILVGSLAALVVHVAATLASEQFGFADGAAGVAVYLIYAGTGFLAEREGGLKLAAVVGAAIGLVYLVLGWAVSWATLPDNLSGAELPVGVWVFVGLMQVATGIAIPAVCAVIGGAIGRATRPANPPAV